MRIPGDIFRVVCSLTVLLTVGGGVHVARADDTGRQLFEGKLPIQARMANHAVELPTAASRCSNCHSTTHPSTQPSTQSGRAGANFGPALNPATLNVVMPRRGGPASRYDVLSFCKTLREGTDPARVVINSAMPRYALSDPQCTALWSFLMSAS